MIGILSVLKQLLTITIAEEGNLQKYCCILKDTQRKVRNEKYMNHRN